MKNGPTTRRSLPAHRLVGWLLATVLLVSGIPVANVDAGPTRLAEPEHEVMPCCRGDEAMPCCDRVASMEASCTCSLRRDTAPPTPRRLAGAVVDQAMTWSPSPAAVPTTGLLAVASLAPPSGGILLVDRPTFLSSLLC